MLFPSIEILGIYALPVTDDLIRDLRELCYGSDLSDDERAKAERQCREQLEPTVLIEVLVRNPDDRFDVGDLSQSQDEVSPEFWQVAWAETYLTEDGKSLLVDRWEDAPRADPLRIAFFIHHWNPAKPFLTSYGEVVCPPVSKMPERLRKLVLYEPIA